MALISWQAETLGGIMLSKKASILSIIMLYSIIKSNNLFKILFYIYMIVAENQLESHPYKYLLYLTRN